MSAVVGSHSAGKGLIAHKNYTGPFRRVSEAFIPVGNACCFMNCESVHIHWIVLCLQARRTSYDPDLRGLTVGGWGGWLWIVSPSLSCPPGDILFNTSEIKKLPRRNPFVLFVDLLDSRRGGEKWRLAR